MRTRNLGGFSARVRLQLNVAGRMLPLSQVGPDYCILQEPINLTAQYAEVIADVDHLQHVRHVRLSNRLSQESMLVHFQECDAGAATPPQLTTSTAE